MLPPNKLVTSTEYADATGLDRFDVHARAISLTVRGYTAGHPGPRQRVYRYGDLCSLFHPSTALPNNPDDPLGYYIDTTGAPAMSTITAETMITDYAIDPDFNDIPSVGVRMENGTPVNLYSLADLRTFIRRSEGFEDA